MPVTRLLPNCEEVEYEHYGLIGIDSTGQENFKYESAFHKGFLMSLKKDPNKKQRLECRNSKCAFSISHEVDEDERGIRKIYIAPNKKNGFKHLNNGECERLSQIERVKIQKWREAEEKARDFPVWCSLQQEKKKKNFKYYLENRENWIQKQVFDYPQPAFTTMYSNLNKFIKASEVFLYFLV